LHCDAPEGLADRFGQWAKLKSDPAEKNPALFARIVAASSKPGDLVPDYFSGSDTTLEAAHRLGRHWIGVDNSPEAIRTTLTRFATGIAPMGNFVRPDESEKQKQRGMDRNGAFPLPGFEDSVSLQTQENRNARHVPITDFRLCVAKGLQAKEVL
jgi:hypothetical protein